jgi:Ser/Thr protein kinase RdoA (MazF antagonist)
MIVAMLAAIALDGSVPPPAVAAASGAASQALDPATVSAVEAAVYDYVDGQFWRVMRRVSAASCIPTWPNAPCAPSRIRTKSWA